MSSIKALIHSIFQGLQQTLFKLGSILSEVSEEISKNPIFIFYIISAFIGLWLYIIVWAIAIKLLIIIPPLGLLVILTISLLHIKIHRDTVEQKEKEIIL